MGFKLWQRMWLSRHVRVMVRCMLGDGQVHVRVMVRCTVRVYGQVHC